MNSEDNDLYNIYIDYYDDGQTVAVIYENKKCVATIDDNLEKALNKIKDFILSKTK